MSSSAACERTAEPKDNGGGESAPHVRFWQRPEAAIGRWLTKKLDTGVPNNVVFRCGVCSRLRSARPFGCRVCGSRRMNRTIARTYDLLWVYLTGR
jgi:hypothetical protein